MKIKDFLNNLPSKVAIDLVFQNLKEDEVLTSGEVLKRASKFKFNMTLAMIERQLQRIPRYAYGGRTYYANVKNIENLKKYLKEREKKIG